MISLVKLQELGFTIDDHGTRTSAFVDLEFPEKRLYIRQYLNSKTYLSIDNGIINIPIKEWEWNVQDDDILKDLTELVKVLVTKNK